MKKRLGMLVVIVVSMLVGGMLVTLGIVLRPRVVGAKQQEISSQAEKQIEVEQEQDDNEPVIHGLPAESPEPYCHWNSTTETWSCEVSCEPQTPKDPDEGYKFDITNWVFAWHGREGWDEAEGHDGEYLVAYRREYLTKVVSETTGASLQWWSADALWLNEESKPPRDEWGNDSLKMLSTFDEDGNVTWFGTSTPWKPGYFPESSWLRPSGDEWEVCQHDQPEETGDDYAGPFGCWGETWKLTEAEQSPPIPILMMLKLDELEEALQGLPDVVREEINIVVIEWQKTKDLGL